MAKEGHVKEELPTVLFTYSEVLDLVLHKLFLRWALADESYNRLEKENAEAFATLTSTWWTDVAPTDKGYQVTLHPSELG